MMFITNHVIMRGVFDRRRAPIISVRKIAYHVDKFTNVRMLQLATVEWTWRHVYTSAG